MRITAWARTDVGNVRDNNEDAHLVDEDHGVFIVADGVGGSTQGEVASHTFVDYVGARAEELADFAASEDPIKDRVHREQVFGRIVHAIQKVNAEIYEVGKGVDPVHPMATTCDVMVLSEQAAFIAHVGDSRVYLIRKGQIFRITEDHTFAEQLKRENVDDAEVIDRYKNVLTRSIGGKPHVDVDSLFIDLRVGDRVLMCSDGLTDYLSGVEIQDFAKRRTGRSLVDGLVDEAKSRGGKDNITAVLVEVVSTASDTVRQTETFDTLKQVDILGRIELFHDLDVRELLKIMRIVYEVSLEDGDVVVEDGGSGRCMYVIAEGAVELFVDDTQIARLDAGEHFGEFALISEELRSATARCVGETLLLAIPAERFRELVSESPAVGNVLLWNMLESAIRHIRRMSGELATRGDDTQDEGDAS